MDEKTKSVRKALMKKLDERIVEYCNKRLDIPGLVGEGCPYSTLSNFFLQFHTKTEYDIKEIKIKQVMYLSR